MKKITNFRMFIEFILIGFSSYLILSGSIAVTGELNYRSVLIDPSQWFGLLFIYWWIPIPRMIDIDDRNKSIEKIKTNI